MTINFEEDYYEEADEVIEEPEEDYYEESEEVTKNRRKITTRSRRSDRRAGRRLL